MLENHELTKEFPEFRDKINQLRTADKHFAEMFEEYHQIDREILSIEQAVEPASDVRAEELKKKLHVLKDTLYHMLQHWHTKLNLFLRCRSALRRQRLS